MKQHEKAERLRLPVHVYLAYLLVVTFIFTGVTFSKYVTSSSGGDSARVAVFGDLTLTEENKPEAYTIIPGVAVKKDPLVTFDGKQKSELAAWVFVTVKADGWKFDGARTYTIDRDTVNLLEWSVDPGWTLLENENGPQVYYRQVAPKAGLKAPVIEGSEITVAEDLYYSDYKNIAVDDAANSITFQAYAVQIQGFADVQAAWASLGG